MKLNSHLSPKPTGFLYEAAALNGQADVLRLCSVLLGGISIDEGFLCTEVSGF
jgi:hypothetical protein